MRSSRKLDRADTLWHYMRLLAPGLHDGCEREYRFHPTRRWRFDFAWPAQRAAVEVDGGRWAPGGGRHSTPGDYQKLRQAVLLSWRVLAFQSSEVESDPQACIDDIIRLLGDERRAWRPQVLGG